MLFEMLVVVRLFFFVLFCYYYYYFNLFLKISVIYEISHQK